MFRFNKPKCPKCQQEEIGEIKASFNTQVKRFAWCMLFPPLLLFVGPAKPTLVCRSCGFSWEKK